MLLRMVLYLNVDSLSIVANTTYEQEKVEKNHIWLITVFSSHRVAKHNYLIKFIIYELTNNNELKRKKRKNGNQLKIFYRKIRRIEIEQTEKLE